MHFDEAVDRVNLDALTVEESDQLVQLCQEAAEAHRQLGEQEQALTVYNALLGFLRSRGWNDKVAQVVFMLKQLQNTPVPQRPLTPPPGAQDATRVFNTDQPTMMQPQVADAATMAFTAPPVQPVAPQPAPPSVNPVVPSAPVSTSGLGELPDWLTGILNDADKTQLANKPPAPPAPVPPQVPAQPSVNMQPAAAEQTQVINMPTSSSWLTEGAQPNTTRQLPPEQPTMVQQPVAAQPTPFAPPPPLAPAPVDPTPRRSARPGSRDQRLRQNAWSRCANRLWPGSIDQARSSTTARNQDRSTRSGTGEWRHPIAAALDRASLKSSGHQVDQSHSR